MSLQDDLIVDICYEYNFEFEFDNDLEDINKLIDEIDYYTKYDEQKIINFINFLFIVFNENHKQELTIIEYNNYYFSNKNIYYEYYNLIEYYVSFILLYCQSHNYPM
jgi:hypothetical protein